MPGTIGRRQTPAIQLALVSFATTGDVCRAVRDFRRMGEGPGLVVRNGAPMIHLLVLDLPLELLFPAVQRG